MRDLASANMVKASLVKASRSQLYRTRKMLVNGQVRPWLLFEQISNSMTNCRFVTIITKCIQNPNLPLYLHVRFRFDKSKNNFTIRKFKRLPGMVVCPVKRALSILQRADILGVPQDYPIGAHRPIRGKQQAFALLNGEDVKTVMQQACVLAYPDSNHYLRLNIDLIMAHSNRIAAAVALLNAGASIPVIAYRLRWSVGFSHILSS